MFIVVDCNCNCWGNYFLIIGHERNVGQDESSYIGEDEKTYYPKAHCYRAKGVEFILQEMTMKTFVYSQAIDHLIPEDYVRWQKTRFKGL